MATTTLNKPSYEVGADNLIAAAQYPVLHRTAIITNPNEAIERGTAIINASGTLYVAGAKDGDDTVAGDIIGIVSADYDADGESETIAVDAYVSGAFNKGHVVTINDLDVTTASYVLGAQGNGIYLV